MSHRLMIALKISNGSAGVSCWLNGEWQTNMPIDVGADNIMETLFLTLNELQPDVVVVTSKRKEERIERLVGIVECYCKINKADFVEYQTNEWQELVKAEDEELPKGKAELKQWAFEAAVSDVDEANVESNDVAEAYLLGKAHLLNYLKQIDTKS